MKYKHTYNVYMNKLQTLTTRIKVETNFTSAFMVQMKHQSIRMRAL